MSTFLAPTRPRTVTITIWGVFLLGIWNAGRAIALGRQSSLLLSLGVMPDPRIRLVLALLWALIFWSLTITLRQKWSLTRQAIPLLILLYALYELGLLLIFSQAPTARRTWLMNVLFYGMIVSFTYWALNRPAATIYFEEG